MSSNNKKNKVVSFNLNLNIFKNVPEVAETNVFISGNYVNNF